MRERLKRAYQAVMKLNVALGLATGLFILVIDVLVVYETVSRYGFNRPTIWVLEITSYLLLYIVFLAAAYTLQEDGHIRVEFGLGRLPRRARRLLLLLADLLSLAFCGVLLWQSTRFTLMALKGSWRATTPLAVPISWISIVIPIGALLLCLTYCLRAMVVIWSVKPDQSQA